jgi:hypothetical protein
MPAQFKNLVIGWDVLLHPEGNEFCVFASLRANR